MNKVTDAILCHVVSFFVVNKHCMYSRSYSKTCLENVPLSRADYLYKTIGFVNIRTFKIILQELKLLRWLVVIVLAINSRKLL